MRTRCWLGDSLIHTGLAPKNHVLAVTCVDDSRVRGNLVTMFDLTASVQDDVGPAAPEGLFAPRRRTHLRGVGSDWPHKGEIGLPIPRSRWSDAIAHGARRHATGTTIKRLFIAKASATEPFLQPYVPMVARRDFVPLRAEMHPRGLWGASLINLLDERGHRAVRQHAYILAGYVCEACGSAHGAMEAWEIWSYHAPSQDRAPGTMRLERVACLCKACHEMVRLDRAAKAKRSEEGYARMRTLNAWSDDEHMAYLDWARRLYAYRSGLSWQLDLSALAGLDRLSLAKAWRSGDEPGTFRATMHEGGVKVRLVGFVPPPTQNLGPAPVQTEMALTA